MRRKGGGGLPVAELPAGCGGCQAKRGGVGEADPKRQAQRAAKGQGAGGRGESLARGRAPHQRGIERPARDRRRSEVPLPATGRPISSGSSMEAANGLGAAPVPVSASDVADDGLDLANVFVGQEPIYEVQRGFVVAGLGNLVFRLILHCTRARVTGGSP